MDSADSKLNRREFLQKGAAVATGGAAMSSSALSYSRIVGANDRISLGHIGVGNRGRELDGIVAFLNDKKNVEVSAVCDVGTHNLDCAVAANQKYYGKSPRALKPPQVALASLGEDDSRSGYRLARLADDQALPAVRSAGSLRVAPLQRFLQRHR